MKPEELKLIVPMEDQPGGYRVDWIAYQAFVAKSLATQQTMTVNPRQIGSASFSVEQLMPCIAGIMVHAESIRKWVEEAAFFCQDSDEMGQGQGSETGAALMDPRRVATFSETLPSHLRRFLLEEIYDCFYHAVAANYYLLPTIVVELWSPVSHPEIWQRFSEWNEYPDGKYWQYSHVKNTVVPGLVESANQLMNTIKSGVEDSLIMSDLLFKGLRCVVDHLFDLQAILRAEETEGMGLHQKKLLYLYQQS